MIRDGTLKLGFRDSAKELVQDHLTRPNSGTMGKAMEQKFQDIPQGFFCVVANDDILKNVIYTLFIV